MGSGHILEYAFDVFMQIYEGFGYTSRDAVRSVLENNLYGLDIDKRAAQLAYFSVMMKARQYDRRVLGRGYEPHLYAVEESNSLSEQWAVGNEEMARLFECMRNAEEYGSLVSGPEMDFDGLRDSVNSGQCLVGSGQVNLGEANFMSQKPQVLRLIDIGEILAQKYDVVVTNPPYMGSSGMGSDLSDFVKKNYPDSKSDLFAVFIERCGTMAAKNGYQAMITQHAWMFLSTYEKLRARILLQKSIINMDHLGARAFEEIGGEVVQTTSFILRKKHLQDYKGVYYRLIEPTTQQGKENMFLNGKNCYIAQQSNFSKIPGSPVAYWVSDAFIEDIGQGIPLSKVARARSGAKTGKNEIFIKNWWEVSIKKVDVNCHNYEECLCSKAKWFPYNKGGESRNWFGNRNLVVNFEKGGENIRVYSLNYGTSIDLNAKDVYFKQGITWTALTSAKNTFRFSPYGSSFDSNKGPMVFLEDISTIMYLLAFFISPVAQYYLKVFNPSLSLQNGDMDNLPIIFDEERKPTIVKLAKQCVCLAQTDWDSFETSWDFKQHSLLPDHSSKIYRSWDHNNRIVQCDDKSIPWSHLLKFRYKSWEEECNNRFEQLKANEEELNRIFIDIYRLQDELTPEVKDRYVTIRKADVGRDIRSLISYAVGCMFGRYSLHKEGLFYAGGLWDYGTKVEALCDAVKATGSEHWLPSELFLPNRDNILLISDEEYFKEDIVSRFVDFIRYVYGKETLEENLQFIANALGGTGAPRQVIRDYFIKDFYKDHCKIYQKRPIYWLFDSGKKNGFKCLVYMHRWNADTAGKVRVDYLHKLQHIYEFEIQRMQETIDDTKNPREATKAAKRKDKLQKQLNETKEYDTRLAHIALSRPTIDLDDGVKVNYEKVQTSRDGKNMKILAKI